MIKIESVKIEEFRGIRDLTINLGGKNYAVCGPNGTGKSGIVDALEFGLTGSISRLTGKGRGEVSVKAHGPHVNSRAKPEKSIVTLTVSIPCLGKTATISRSVKSPRNPVIVPDEPDIRAALEHAQRHPEFALSRREIIKYVLAEPGERAKELQALLQLDSLETTRSLLLRISNACNKETKPLESQRTSSAESLMRALEVSDLRQSTVLDAVNKKRIVLGLAPLQKIEASTSIRDGLESKDATAPVRVPKIQAREDIAAALAATAELDFGRLGGAFQKALSGLKSLKDSETKLAGVTRDTMLQTALDLFDEQQCPVCETPWEPQKFREVIATQRAALAAAAQERRRVQAFLEPIVKAMEAVAPSLRPLALHARNLPTPLDAGAIAELARETDGRVVRTRSFLPIDETIAAIEMKSVALNNAQRMIAELSAAVEALPEPNVQDSARDYLTVGQERLEAWRQAATRHEAAKKKAAVAERVHAIYGETCDRALEAIYKEVEGEFRALYRAVNGDDESEFEAQLTPSLGKLGFEVDFYGKGFFPPGAYHSEGHQDGMGLCLYLALMKHLLGPKFTCAVLDDVLMSVDAGHRREVCAVLKAAFPDTQFVLTTHDPVWMNHMRTSKLIEGRSAITFRKWHVDHGPAEWKDTDVWAEIDELVDKNEIRAAASQLRYYVEYVAAEWSSRLGGRVEYRADGRYELGDLLPAALGAMSGLYKQAKSSAQSWGKGELRDELQALHDDFVAAVGATQVDQWQINPAVHYNEWANFHQKDFAPVVAAFKELERKFGCPKCGEPLYLVRSGHENEALRCACSATNFNLKTKSKDAAAT